MNFLKEFLIYVKKVLRLCWLVTFLKTRDFHHYLLILWYDFKIRLGFNRQISPKGVSREAKIHCLYFTCGRDFEYLFISLKSLGRLSLSYIGNVYLYIDKKDPLSGDQINRLKKEFLFNILIRTTKYRLEVDGVKLIISELAAFKEITKEINRNDYILKLDSDVMFISDKIFKEVITGESEAVGVGPPSPAFHRMPEPFRFMHGGSWFLRGSLIYKLLNQPIRGVTKKFNKNSPELYHRTVSTLPEDIVISLLISQIGKINFVWDLCFNARGISDLTKKNIEQYSVVHFSPWFGLRKEQMPVVWGSICRDGWNL